MAELNSEPLQLAAAVTAITLISGRKLARNFVYYRSEKQPGEYVFRNELLILCRRIRMEMFGMHNLMENREKRFSPYLVAMAGEINDCFEELHRKLLFFDTSVISEIIPDIDRQRLIWKQYTDELFYNENLNLNLETSFPDAMKAIESGISKLPVSARC
jgi:hypothetical protein